MATISATTTGSWSGTATMLVSASPRSETGSYTPVANEDQAQPQLLKDFEGVAVEHYKAPEVMTRSTRLMIQPSR